MNANIVVPGDFLCVRLPSHIPAGHEPYGLRLVIVVGIPPGVLRYPVIIVVPLTTQDGSWVDNNPDVYLQIQPGVGGLHRKSIALNDQLRAVDVHRVELYTGNLQPYEWAEIQKRLQKLF